MLSRRRLARVVVRLAGAACVLLISGATPAAEGKATYLFSLASFAGPMRYDGVRVNTDLRTEETFVVYQDRVHIFNASGMEVFRFGDDLDLGHIVDATADPAGNIVLLSYKDDRSVVTRCSYRGVPIGEISIAGLPDEQKFRADRMIQRNGLFYFAMLANASVIATDTDGRFRFLVDLVPNLEPEERNAGAEAMGFTVDGEGNIFLTAPTLFRVFKRSPDGRVSSFGRSGSAPGQFGIVAGVGTDSQGNVFVADKLKSVVMVFDRNFRFLTEFGYRGLGKDNLIVPEDLAIDRRDRVYVSQWRGRGVSVFALALR